VPGVSEPSDRRARRCWRACDQPITQAKLTRSGPGAKEDDVTTIEANPNLGAEIVADAKEHVLYSWSVQSAINPIAVAGADGRHFWDYEGKRYLDFASQLVNVNIGHQHPKIIQAIKDQADQLCTIGPPMANESRSRLGRMLAEVTPGDLSVSFFTNGGAEANENAVKLARLATGRHKIIARYRSYHGATNGAVTLTGDPRRWAAEPGMPGVVRMFDPYTYRCSAGHPDPCPVCTGAPHLEEILEYEGAHTVAAVILETVTGTNGVIVPPDGYLQSIRETCTKHGILLILDEVMAGFGRTGKWFACEHWDVVPDILTVAKGINSGYVPLGAMIASREVIDKIRDRFFPGGLTYAGHPLACASAIASIEAFQEEGVVENAAAMGEWFAQSLRELATRHPSIGDVRGLGCFFGLELVKNRGTREMLVPYNAAGEAATPVARMVRAALERGLYLMTHWNVVMVVPPLTVTLEEAQEGVAILDEVLAIADEYVE
jgi:taurine---2-oxoglutarate transaminase